MKDKIDAMNKELTERTDYESESYIALVDKYTQEHDRYLMLGGKNYEAEIEKVLIGLGFYRSDFERPTSEFSGGWRMRIELAKYYLANQIVSFLTNRPIILILKVYNGWSVSCNKVQKLWYSSVTTKLS